MRQEASEAKQAKLYGFHSGSLELSRKREATTFGEVLQATASYVIAPASQSENKQPISDNDGTFAPEYCRYLRLMSAKVGC